MKRTPLAPSIVPLTTAPSKFIEDYQAHIKNMMKDRGVADEYRENVIQEFWHPLTPDEAKVKFRKAYNSNVTFENFLQSMKLAQVVTK